METPKRGDLVMIEVAAIVEEVIGDGAYVMLQGVRLFIDRTEIKSIVKMTSLDK